MDDKLFGLLLIILLGIFTILPNMIEKNVVYIEKKCECGEDIQLSFLERMRLRFKNKCYIKCENCGKKYRLILLSQYIIEE